MSKEKQENDHPAVLGMIEKLCQRYTKTFTHEPHDVRPLARGIREAIVADAPDLPASIVSQALAIYADMAPLYARLHRGRTTHRSQWRPRRRCNREGSDVRGSTVGSTGTQARRGQS